MEPLEITKEMSQTYQKFLEKAAAESKGGCCGCIVIGPSGKILAVAAEEVDKDKRPLRHAVMAAIDAVALARSSAETVGQKRERAEEEYLCQDCEVVTTHEPCVMCAMALVHSRVRRVIFREADPEFGGLGGAISLHTCTSLNHQFRVLRWIDKVVE
eukprot:TRINITY_DN10227_c0_g1_i1.p1 TRINITY_DN10227_c0_g1~~TRINITY_DN10227_c0_g1_i1.p1  ORF type:complete len:157 (-),score=34.36 TRINITY_DN10227_c0_g1_i1:27-497(-)